MDEKRKEEIREGVDAADATGMVAGEELITEAQTLIPVLRQQAALPHKDLHAALPVGHHAHAVIDELHAEIQRPTPSHDAIKRHTTHLRALPELEAIIVTWWDNPKTQRFVDTLAQIGV
jgi:hypothetical protein